MTASTTDSSSGRAATRSVEPAVDQVRRRSRAAPPCARRRRRAPRRRDRRRRPGRGSRCARSARQSPASSNSARHDHERARSLCRGRARRSAPCPSCGARHRVRRVDVLAEIALEFETGEDLPLARRGSRRADPARWRCSPRSLLIRTSARLMRSPKVPWWPGSIQTEGGLHVHHLVFGIVLMLLAGFVLALQPGSPGLEIMAAAVRHRRRAHARRVRALAAPRGRLLGGGGPPVGRRGGDRRRWSAAWCCSAFCRWPPTTASPVIVLSVLATLALAGRRDRQGQGGAGRGGDALPAGRPDRARSGWPSPDSPWARRRYTPDGKKMAKAERRFTKHTARYQRFQDRVAGSAGAAGYLRSS